MSTRVSTSSNMAAATRDNNVHVVVRIRPRNEREVKENSNVVITTPGLRSKEVIVRAGAEGLEKRFLMDRVFGPETAQHSLFNEIVKPMLDDVLNGYSSTLFAYGATSTGKTHAIIGNSMDPTHETAGMIPRAMVQLFSHLANQESIVKVSLLELYNEELQDLLATENRKLRLIDDPTGKSNGVVVHGLEEVHVYSAQDVLQVLQRGAQKRQTAGTNLNDKSSRSHVIFSATVHLKQVTSDGEELFLTGKLHMVDLAGSECIGRSGAHGKVARESGMINQSLLTLGRVINALVERSTHIPYRESKLTRLLMDSLGGKSKTTILATLSPAKINLEESLSTLEYASRAKNIKNKPEMNTRVEKKEYLNDFTNEMKRLRADLEATRDKNGVYLSQMHYQELLQEKEGRGVRIEELERIQAEREEELRVLHERLDTEQKLRLQTERDLQQTSRQLKHTEDKLYRTTTELDSTRVAMAETSIQAMHLCASERNLHVLATGMETMLSSSCASVEELHEALSIQTALHKKHQGIIDKLDTTVSNQLQAMDTAGSAWFKSTFAQFSQVEQSLQELEEARKLGMDKSRSEIQKTSAQLVEQLGLLVKETVQAWTGMKQAWLTQLTQGDSASKNLLDGSSLHHAEWENAVQHISEQLDRSSVSLGTLLGNLSTKIHSILNDASEFVQQHSGKLEDATKQSHRRIQAHVLSATQRVQALEKHVEAKQADLDKKQSELMNGIGALVARFSRDAASGLKEVHHAAWTIHEQGKTQLEHGMVQDLDQVTKLRGEAIGYVDKFTLNKADLDNDVGQLNKSVLQARSLAGSELNKQKVHLLKHVGAVVNQANVSLKELMNAGEQGARDAQTKVNTLAAAHKSMLQHSASSSEALVASLEAISTQEARIASQVQSTCNQLAKESQEHLLHNQKLVKYVQHTLTEAMRGMDWNLPEPAPPAKMSWPKTWPLAQVPDQVDVEEQIKICKQVPFAVRDFFLQPRDGQRPVHVDPKVPYEGLDEMIAKVEQSLQREETVESPLSDKFAESPSAIHPPKASNPVPATARLSRLAGLNKQAIQRQGSSSATLYNSDL